MAQSLQTQAILALNAFMEKKNTPHREHRWALYELSILISRNSDQEFVFGRTIPNETLALGAPIVVALEQRSPKKSTRALMRTDSRNVDDMLGSVSGRSACAQPMVRQACFSRSGCQDP
jgi:hypothetical protein